MKKSANIVAVFLGDGATEQGVFFESLDFASLKDVPILFVCENNLYSVYSNLKVRQSPNRKISKLAESHGIKAFTGNGNDVQQVSELTREAIDYIKNQHAPAFIELETFRWLEHCGPNFDDELDYRQQGELDQWLAKCPIKSYKSMVIETGQVTEEEILNQFSDVPFPPDTILDLTKSVVVGAEENWFGQIFFNSNRSSNEVFSYFKDHMPDTGWFLIMEQQGNQIFLVYEKDLRVAIVNIARKRAGSEAILAVGPRAQ